MTLAAFSTAELDALEAHAFCCVLPIAVAAGERVAPRGTGMLFRFGERIALLTAAHVVHQTDALHDIMVAQAPGAHAYVRIEAQAHHTPADVSRDADVSVLMLPRELGEQLAAHWAVLDATHIAEDDAHEAWHFIAGYPARIAQERDTRAAPALFSVYTRALPQVPPGAREPVDASLDRFYAYSRGALRASDAAHTSTPELEGLSGAPVWWLDEARKRERPDDPAHWARVVAIQTAFRHTSHIRAHALAPVLRALLQQGA